MKAKKIIITLAFALLMLGLKAQEKYEYASVSCRFYSNSKVFISISKQGKFEQNEVKVSDGVAYENLVPLIEVVNKMNKDGWEVYANYVNGAIIYYSLRKKIN